MKNKYITAILAFFFGWLGVHRFYLGQRGNGIAFMLLSFVGIGFFLAFIDSLIFLFMDEAKFDYKYNRDDRERMDYERSRRRRDRYEPRESRRQESRRQERRERRAPEPRTRKRASGARKASKVQVHMREAKEHFAAFDYFEAIAQWHKGLEYEPENAAIHYNLACAYSLTENAEEGFNHLEQAIKAGFNNFEKLKEQDALAFLRIQPEFDDFIKNNYQTKSKKVAPEKEQQEKVVPPAPAPTNILSKDILQQLKELGELRDRGILTEEEFIAQKKKLI